MDPSTMNEGLLDDGVEDKFNLKAPSTGGGVDHPHAKRGASMIGELLTTYLSKLCNSRLSTTVWPPPSDPQKHTAASIHHEYCPTCKIAADSPAWRTAADTVTTRLEKPFEAEGVPHI